MPDNPELVQEQTQLPGFETKRFDADAFARDVARSGELRVQRDNENARSDVNKEIPENRVGILAPGQIRHASNMVKLIRATQLRDKGEDINGKEGGT